MKVVGYLAVFIGGLVVGYLALAMGVVDAVDGLPGNADEPHLSLPTYLSFLSVMMTAVTVVLAALAIGVGIVAAYTVEDIKKRANDTVENAARNATIAAEKAISIALSEEVINNCINKIAFGKRQPPTVAELEESFDQDDDGNR
jgi:cytochrome bd-type quinol oxidase subunit 2